MIGEAEASMKSENRRGQERRVQLRVLPGGLLEKERAARRNREQKATKKIPLAWKLFFLGVFAGVLASVMVAYIRLILRI